MTAVVITHQVTYGGTTLTTVLPGADPVELPAAVAAEVIRHGLGRAPPAEPKPLATPD